MPVRIGTWAESRITFTPAGRSVRRSPSGLANYLRIYAARLEIPASSTLGEGGSVRIGSAVHGLDSVWGAISTERNAGAPATPVSVSVITATTIRFEIQGYTAATTYADVLIFGTSSV